MYLVKLQLLYINLIDIDQSALNNILNRYDVRWKSQGILTKYNMFDEDVQKLLDNYYENNFRVIPMSSESLTPDVSGTFNIDQLTHMYLPANIPLKDSPMFCKNKKFEWDSRSIPISTDEDCVMDQSSIQKYPNTDLLKISLILGESKNALKNNLYMPLFLTNLLIDVQSNIKK